MFLTLVEKQQEEFLTGWKTVLNSKTPFECERLVVELWKATRLDGLKVISDKIQVYRQIDNTWN